MNAPDTSTKLAHILIQSQKIQYAKELIKEAGEELLMLSRSTKIKTREPLLVAIDLEPEEMDELFIVSFQIAKIIKRDLESIQDTLDRLVKMNEDRSGIGKTSNQNHAKENHDATDYRAHLGLVPDCAEPESQTPIIEG